MKKTALLIFAAAQIGLSVYALAASCESCSRGLMKIVPFAGIAFYALAAFAVKSNWRCVPALLLAGLAAHTSLYFYMNPHCSLCTYSLFSLLAMNLIASESVARASLKLLAFLLCANLAMSFSAKREPANADGLTVYVKDGCAYCAKFKNEFAPKLRAAVTYVPESAAPAWVSAFPTIVVTRAGRIADIFPGLPTFETLSEALR